MLFKYYKINYLLWTNSKHVVYRIGISFKVSQAKDIDCITKTNQFEVIRFYTNEVFILHKHVVSELHKMLVVVN